MRRSFILLGILFTTLPSLEGCATDEATAAPTNLTVTADEQGRALGFASFEGTRDATGSNITIVGRNAMGQEQSRFVADGATDTTTFGTAERRTMIQGVSAVRNADGTIAVSAMVNGQAVSGMSMGNTLSFGEGVMLTEQQRATWMNWANVSGRVNETLGVNRLNVAACVSLGAQLVLFGISCHAGETRACIQAAVTAARFIAECPRRR